MILCLLLAGAASAAMIQATSATISGPGQKIDIPVTLDSGEKGLAGYKMSLVLSTPGIARITAVSMPEWAALKNVDGTLPAESVTLTAVDLMDSVKVGAAAVPLATISVEGVTSGTSDLSITFKEITDDDGNPIEFTLVPASITVGGSAQNQTTVVTPTSTPTLSPVTPDQPGPTVPLTTVPTAGPTGAPTQAPLVVPTTLQPVGPLATPTPVPTVVADFRADLVSGSAPMTVSFTDLSAGFPTKFVWDFGDASSDNSSVVANPQHTYKNPGIYSVTLHAANNQYNNTTTRSNYIVAASMRMPQRGPKTTMSVFSVPDGAEVYLNSAYQGKTPLNVTNLTPRTYQLRLHKEGYYDVVEPVIANNGVLPTFISGFEMVPHYAEIGKLVADPPQTGAAYIISYPDLTDVFIDDKKVGKTDVMVMNLAAGIHNLTLVRNGFANWTDSLDVRNGLGVIQSYTYEKPYFPPTRTVEYVDMKV